MHSFFARTDVGAVGATDSLVQSVRWVEPGCRDDRPGLPLTIGSTGLPLYLPYIYILKKSKKKIYEPVQEDNFCKTSSMLYCSRTKKRWALTNASRFEQKSGLANVEG
jgi:hypothetical protein